MKAAVVDPDGRLLAVAAREYPIATPRPGWAEQDPADWLAAALAAIPEAIAAAGVPPAQIAGIGLSGQMHGPVCLDARGQALRPAIIWADQRSAPQVFVVYDKLGRPQLGRWTANPLAAGFMLATWLWLRQHEPETAAATAHLLLPKDYLRLCLTGELGSEPSDASATLLFDTAGRRWSDELLDALAIDARLLPPLGASAAVAGGLRPEVAAATGLRPGTPVVYGAADQACQAVGNGVLAPGLVSCTIGTGGQLLAPLLAPAYDPLLRLHCFCHALPDRWYQLAATLAAGLSLRWLRDNVFEGRSYGELAAMAAEVPAGAEGLFYLPYLAGERTPHMDPQARGVFAGLGLHHDRRHLVRAVMEGVVFALREGLELMEELGGPIAAVLATGGASQHALWLQLQADIFNRPVMPSAVREAAATGAALLAGVGAGVYADVETACRRAVPHPLPPILPDPARAAVYADAYRTYRQLYPALAPLWAAPGMRESTGAIRSR